MLALAASTAVLVGVVAVKSGSGGDGERDYASFLQRCSAMTEVSVASAQNCLDKVMRQAIDRQDVKRFAGSLLAATADDVAFRDVCHSVSHGIGEYALNRYPSIDEVLLDTDTRACQEGLAHGVAEAFALEERTEAEWGMFAKACANAVINGENHGHGCTHGTGHALFLATDTPEVGALFQLCEELVEKVVDRARSPFREGCAYGVAMSNWSSPSIAGQPDGRAVSRIEKSEEAAQLCASAGTTNETRLGCMAGFGFSMGENLYKMRYTADPQNPTYVPTLVTTYLRSCLSVAEEELSERCVGQYLQHIARLYHLDAAQFLAFCGEMGRAADAEGIPLECLRSARLTLDASVYQILLEEDRELAAALDTGAQADSNETASK